MEYEVGIALSGGGARGIAQIGVLEALAKHGIEPDCVSGTSSGAIVGALYATGYSADEMLEFFETKNPFRLSKLALHKPGFIDTEKVVADFREYFPQDSFERLKKKLFLTATDIVNGRLEIFTSGPLIKAVLASSSVPLVFTPTEIQDRWFSDGGILDNFPVEPLKAHCSAIIGVYASPLRPIHQSDLKTSIAVSQRAFELGMYHASKERFHECDVLISPPELSNFGPFDTKKLHDIREIGYRATIERIAEIRQVVADRLGRDPAE